MTFPYPRNPNDWQTAYTRNQAHRDSRRRGNTFLALIILCFLIALGYAYIFLYAGSSSFIKTYIPFVQKNVLWFILLSFLAFAFATIISSIRITSQFLSKYYCPPDGIDLSKIISYRLFGRSMLPPPLNLLFQFKYLLVNDGEIGKKDEWPAWCARNLGGPLMLIIFDGNALYLERGNRFSRVVGPGDKIPFLEWYETIKYVVDLRPKKKDGSIDVWTKDGINITLKIQIECRVGNPVKNEASANLVYQYDPEAVKRAFERHSVRWPKRVEGEPPEEFTWIDAAWGQVTGIVPGYVSSRTIDDLFRADENGGQILSPAAIEDLSTRLNNATNGFGVFVTDFQILKIKAPDEVESLLKEYWKAQRQSIAIVREGEAKALSTRLQAKARAEAQRSLILAIADGLGRNADNTYEEALLLSLSRVLDDQSQDPLFKAYFARETLETLEKLQKILG